MSENEDISLTEVEIMRELSQHPNIITMLGSFIDIDFNSQDKEKDVVLRQDQVDFVEEEAPAPAPAKKE